MAGLFGNSAFTLRQQSPTTWSFSKETRFKPLKVPEESDFISPVSSLNQRSTSIGFGERWKPRNPMGNDSPPPGTYNLPSTLNKDTGPRIVRASLLPPVGHRHLTPGPGAYETMTCVGKNSPKYSFRGRERLARGNDNPPPNAYHPNSTLTEHGAFKNIGFGYGNRVFLRAHMNDTPGPGSYNIESNFDKIKKF